MFLGRKLFIATKHKKETVIAPIIEEALGVICYTNTNFDTDILGTFCGEIDRTEDPLTTARNKCLLGMEYSNADLGIASEGSFGALPNAFFVQANEEILIFIDKINQLEIVVKEVSLTTNFNGSVIKSEQELISFAQKAKFPKHGLIAKKNQEDTSDMVKGIQSWEHLMETYKIFMSQYQSFYVETDMRALYNPTRMNVIEKAAKKLVTKINTFCPACNTPGFGISKSKSGLPCAVCNAPTQSLLSHLHSCQKCNYTHEEMYPNGMLKQEPMYCDYCNP
jgi:hypothetical protein